ncbi:Bug family tripartite tricarboxylate transporter substrate binding protein [Caenimonas aquaedulcis]|uniref:Tripartite tricarboxylate transporter substrate binding protein n=1 Tax=Caenimonas aquaedulcis TaxID=2793270 RepID=A0A931H440_9BURK|nr:tripartite tricarboxylate transporter substrate binding protein [Caenimonas aquaedulcis]MBG9388110.1 tripartite tricarboxylate transporter substrate binding protein [Caenimonas aquaedulcis]
MKQLAVAASLVWALLAGGVHAQDRTVRLVVPVPAGGSLDMLARGLATKLSTPGGETWVVDNRPGAETMIGSEAVARAPADGRTVLLAGSTLVLAPLTRRVNFSPVDELRPVVQLSYSNYLLVVPAESRIASAADVASAAASRPGGLNCGAPPGPMALACTQLGARLGGKVTPIPFAGVAPAVTATLGGHVDILFVSAESAVKLVEAGKLRVLAGSSPGIVGTHPVFPDVWPGFLMDGFIGLFVPAATPPDEVKRLNAAANHALNDPALAAAMHDAGQEPVGGTQEQFASHMQRTQALYADLIRKLGLGPR